MNTISLDELLYGNPSWEQVANFFQHGEFCEESYLVEAIKKHLRTEQDRQALFTVDVSIEDMLNGRVYEQAKIVTQDIFNRWNEKLGFRHFGF